jgi:hypothetical protein
MTIECHLFHPFRPRLLRSKSDSSDFRRQRVIFSGDARFHSLDITPNPTECWNQSRHFNVHLEYTIGAGGFVMMRLLVGIMFGVGFAFCTFAFAGGAASAMPILDPTASVSGESPQLIEKTWWRRHHYRHYHRHHWRRWHHWHHWRRHYRPYRYYYGYQYYRPHYYYYRPYRYW